MWLNPPSNSFLLNTTFQWIYRENITIVSIFFKRYDNEEKQNDPNKEIRILEKLKQNVEKKKKQKQKQKAQNIQQLENNELNAAGNDEKCFETWKTNSNR